MRITVSDVWQEYPTERNGGRLTALSAIDLEVAPGEFVSVVGPSGCGKSSLLELIAGLQRPTRGEIRVNSDHGGAPVLILQEAALLPWLTTLGNVEFGLKLRKVPWAERRRIALEQLAMVGLSDFANARPHQLSGGMKQRAAIARALALDPPVLLMDEPFAAVDAQTRGVLHNELLRIWAATGKTIVFVTHSVPEAVFLADRVVLMSARPGRIRDVVEVNLPRPRSADDTRLVWFQQAVSAPEYVI